MFKELIYEQGCELFIFYPHSSSLQPRPSKYHDGLYPQWQMEVWLLIYWNHTVTGWVVSDDSPQTVLGIKKEWDKLHQLALFHWLTSACSFSANWPKTWILLFRHPKTGPHDMQKYLAHHYGYLFTFFSLGLILQDAKLSGPAPLKSMLNCIWLQWGYSLA